MTLASLDPTYDLGLIKKRSGAIAIGMVTPTHRVYVWERLYAICYIYKHPHGRPKAKPMVLRLPARNSRTAQRYLGHTGPTNTTAKYHSAI